MTQPIKVFQRAFKAHQAGAFKEAEKLYRKVLHQHPGHSASHRLLGTLLAQQGDYMAAEQYLRQALMLDPNDAETNNNLGIICSETERFDEAIACYERALKINPNFASAWNNLGDAYRSQRRLDDAEHALRRALSLDGRNIDALNNLGILLQEQGRNAAALEAFQAVLDLNPRHEKTLFNMGQLLRKLEDYAQAEACYRQLLAINQWHVSGRVNLAVLLTDKARYTEAESLLLGVLEGEPDHAIALYNLANLRRCQGDHAAALDLYARVLGQDPDDAQALSGLGVALFEQGNVEEGLRATQRALTLNPFSMDAYVNLGYIQTKLGQYTEALNSYQHALRLESGNPHARLNYAINLLLLGHFEEGWSEYESRFTAQPYNCPRSPLVDVPTWDGSSWEGMWLFVFAEQGYGDTLQFVRFFSELKARGIKILFACQEPLIKLLKGHADLVIPLFERNLPCKPDYQLPLLSLPRILKTGLDTIPNHVPYVSPPEDLVREWRERLGAIAGIKVGLVWAGSPTHKNDRNRSIPLVRLAPLFQVEGVTFVSLQLGSAADQAASAQQANKLVNLTEAIADFADTAALIANLDLVISVDTSVVHLAGAMGKPVWVLLPFAPDWRWLLDREDSPWYPTMRLFRQSKAGDWETVIQAVVAALDARELSPVTAMSRANPDTDRKDLEVESALSNEAGEPRFRLYIPRHYLSDPGIAFLVQHETRYGGYEYPTRKFVDEHLRPGDLFIDVGAHWGIYTLTAVTRYPNEIRALAIEPDAENVRQLRRMLALNGVEALVEVIQAAAGREPGEALLRWGGTMGHSCVSAHPEGVKIPVVSLDHVLQGLPDWQHRRVFLKIDAEGFEPEVLHGAERLLASGRVAAVIWEKGTYYDDQPGVDKLRRALKHLEEFGFVHWRFPDENAGGSLQPFEINDERCNIFSLRGIQPHPVYEKPWGEDAPPVPRAGSGTYVANLRFINEAERRKAVIAEQQTDIECWSDPTQLEPAWDARAEVASRFIPMGADVVDLGCGAMALERFLPAGCSYQPVDVVRRDARTIVCDLNRRELPEDALAKADVVTMLGVLEYLYDLPAFLTRLAAIGKPAIVSYCATDFTSQLDRAALGWVNHYDLTGLVQQILAAGFSVQRIEKIDRLQVMLSLKPRQLEQLRPRRVLVLSYNNVGNFGDRLGYHLIHQVLPAHAVVTHANFHPWRIPEDVYDLLVLGVGNSLFAPLLTEQLLRLLDRVPSSIGIFGTQYREDFHPSQLTSVLTRLDHWFARYEEDALLYGKGHNHVSHLGDWLIDAFPMARWQQDKTLDIGQEVWNDLPLDRVIQKIQMFRKVNSTRLHPLLCALTSAESVAYVEQRETSSDTCSGKFRSMLIDVFGKDLPEKQFWDVDRDAVLAYKRKVADGIAQLRALLHQLLS